MPGGRLDTHNVHLVLFQALMVIAGLAFEFHLAVFPSVILYIGPDVFLPLTSALAAIIGVVLMFWNRLVGIGRTLWLKVTGRPDHDKTAP